MIVEHIFITTMEAPEAMQAAADVLWAGGFGARVEAGAPPPPNALDVVRGRKNAAQAKSIDELPQRLRVEWDRGRVTVAASIEYFAHGSFSFGSRQEPAPHSPKLRPHIELVHAIVGSLEMALAQRVPVEEARRYWMELEARLRTESSAKRRRRNIILWSIVGLIVLAIVLIIFASTR